MGSRNGTLRDRFWWKVDKINGPVAYLPVPSADS